MFGPHPLAPELLTRLGIKPEEFGDPERRVPYRVAMHVFSELVEVLGDPTVGLRPGCGGGARPTRAWPASRGR